MNNQEIQSKIAEITAEIASITEFAEGSVSKSCNKHTRKDGTVVKDSPHYKFQSLGARGKRTYRNIPKDQVARVKQLVAYGKRYRRLETEFARLMSEASLDALKKTKEEN